MHQSVDQILVVDDGQIVQRGIHEELVTVPGKLANEERKTWKNQENYQEGILLQ